MNLKIFIDTDNDLMLSRYIMKHYRNGKDLDSIIDLYLNKIKISFEKFIEPYKEKADLVIKNFCDNVLLSK